MSHLQSFKPSEIFLSAEEAYAVLKFYWPDLKVKQSDLNESDVEYAQGLLVEGIDASYKMGYAHLIFDCFFMKPPGSFVQVNKMVRSFLKKAAKHWFRHIQAGNDLNDAKIYNAVRGVIALNFRSDAIIRFTIDKQ